MDAPKICTEKPCILDALVIQLPSSSQSVDGKREKKMRPGEFIDNRYQIIKEIGKGGGGIVFLANHLSLKQKVVLKQIKFADSYTDQKMLRNEVDILKRLKHPALPQVYDFLKIDGLVFTAMEYIPGYSLQENMDAGTVFPQEKVLMWARQLSDILEYMHTRKHPVIHRDIKPSNIMLKPDWNVSLINFNISDDTATSYGV
ncbi:MAG: protein kinase [Eubacterium sp.]|nr:protein kinase [Eubacterium sp.]